MVGAKQLCSTTKGKVGMVTTMDSRIKAAVILVWLASMGDTGYLVAVFEDAE